jgi:uncharacterized protein (DUF488 family)
MSRRVATVGVYEHDLASFLGALESAGVTKVLDIRQRRGVRGPLYAWANAVRLEASLLAAGIGYEHHPEFAPTTELREVQYREDAREGVGKRSRVSLSAQYIRGYTEEVLDLVPITVLERRLPVHGIGALLCVEATAAACHRSLVAARLASECGYDVIDLDVESSP